MDFADNIVIISVATAVKEIEQKTNITIQKVGAWLDEADLALDARKMEAVLIVERMEVSVGYTKIGSKRTIKYLRLIMDDRLNFKEHMNYIDENLSVEEKRKLSSVYCLSAIRQISGFRTVSDEAVRVLAKTVPVDILADQMRLIHFRRFECPGQTATIKAGKRRTSTHKWESRWEHILKGIWTFHLVPDKIS